MAKQNNITASDQSLKKILIPVDYSDSSRLACKYAAKIACKLSAEVKFFHAYFTPSLDMIELSGTAQIQSHLRDEVASDLESSEKNNAEEFLKEVEKSFAECKSIKIPISYEVKPGAPEDEISAYCEEYHPDMVIMGTHGKGSANTIMGSVTESMIRKLKCPVMAIPEHYQFEGSMNLKSLMYVTEFDESDFASIKKLMNLTAPLNLNIYCLHIGEEEGEWDRVKMDGLKEYFRKAYGRSKVNCGFVSGKNLIENINGLVQSEKINILSLTSRRRNIIEKLFRENLTKKLFYHSNIPLLVFHG